MPGSRSINRLRRRQHPSPGWWLAGTALVVLLAGILAAGPRIFNAASTSTQGGNPSPPAQGTAAPPSAQGTALSAPGGLAASPSAQAPAASPSSQGSKAPQATATESAGLRLLVAPAAQIQGGVTLTVETLIADAQRTVLVYRVEGLPADAILAPSGPQNRPVLRLPDGAAAPYRSGGQDSPSRGYAEFGALPPAVNQLTFELPRLPLLRQGDAPENWRLFLRLTSGSDSSRAGSTRAAASSPTPRPAALFTPAPTLAPSALDALIQRVQSLLRQGYGGFSGQGGWIHMIDENYGQGAAAGASPTRLRVETWYELDPQDRVTRYVTWQRRPDGALEQSSAARGATAYDLVRKQAYPYVPAQLTFDWGLLRGLQDVVARLGLKVKTEDAVCAGQLCLKVTLIDEYRDPLRAPGQKAATVRAESEYQLDLGSGRILLSETRYYLDDGSVSLTGGRPLLIERASSPPAEVEAVFQSLEKP